MWAENESRLAVLIRKEWFEVAVVVISVADDAIRCVLLINRFELLINSQHQLLYLISRVSKAKLSGVIFKYQSFLFQLHFTFGLVHRYNYVYGFFSH